MSAARICPIAGCGSGLRQGYLMCLKHWQMVPLKAQRAVNRTWRELRAGTGGMAEYNVAVKAAIAAIAAEIARSLP